MNYWRRPKKPRYYLRASFNYPEWWVICQIANNVMVCECPEKQVAELILDFLNDIPGSVLGRLRAK